MKIKKMMLIALSFFTGTAFVHAASDDSAFSLVSPSDFYAAWNFDESEEQTGGYYTWAWDNGSGFAVADAGGYAVLGGNGSTPSATSALSYCATNSFTFSFDVSNVSMDVGDVLFSLRDSNGAYLALGNVNGVLTLYSVNGSGDVGFGKGNNAYAYAVGNVSDFSGKEWKTITITSSSTPAEGAETGGTLMVYVDGNGVAGMPVSTDWSACFVNGIQFGAMLDSTTQSVNSAHIDNVALWGEALTEAEVAMIVVPEPSSFGLFAGLCAIALVIARRRRDDNDEYEEEE